jgi:hypothetical protein
MAHFCRLASGFLLVLAASSNALALCGDVDGDEAITARDALIHVRVIVGMVRPIACSCDDCGDAVVARAFRHCGDVNGDSEATVQDTFAILRAALGLELSPACTCDSCEGSATTTTTVTTTTSTTTTLPCLAGEDALDGRIFIRKSHCRANRVTCAPTSITLVTDTIEFRHIGAGQYEVRSVPGGQLLNTGTLNCNKLTFSRAEIWTFKTDDSFAGRKLLSCRITGAESPTVPPNPPRPCI